jgi:hypothetical protein
LAKPRGGFPKFNGGTGFGVSNGRGGRPGGLQIAADEAACPATAHQMFGT